MNYPLDSALILGIMAGGGVYLILQWSFLHILLGFVILTNAANLFVLSVSGDPVERAPAIIVEGVSAYMDPLPQALLLTAVVIGFGMTSFLLVLLYRIHIDNRTANIKSLFRTGDEGEQ